MSETLPLFPLATVLYPGVLLPLHVFEDRYRILVRDLLAQAGPRLFGVIAIREGRETGPHDTTALHDIGCTASLRRADELTGGRYSLVTVGVQRFRLAEIDGSRPYLQGKVDLLAEDTGDEAEARNAARAVQAAFRRYVDAVTRPSGKQVHVPDLTDEPVALSYLVASSMVVDLPDKQALLAEPDAASRLNAERALLSRETMMLRTLATLPDPSLGYPRGSPN